MLLTTASQHLTHCHASCRCIELGRKWRRHIRALLFALEGAHCRQFSVACSTAARAPLQLASQLRPSRVCACRPPAIQIRSSGPGESEERAHGKAGTNHRWATELCSRSGARVLLEALHPRIAREKPRDRNDRGELKILREGGKVGQIERRDRGRWGSLLDPIARRFLNLPLSWRRGRYPKGSSSP